MTYVIESVRNHDGSVHERELRRKGQRIIIVKLGLFSPLLAVYVDDGDAVLQTSNVIAYDGKGTDCDTVKTRNTIYTFRKEATS
ncbi:hypothetical protein [Paenibacillus sp. YIM B09110]|uniref:hypothetical protein n=1 Tax=Paenibacillus sp. YIM B09110 TaxID=3126102 RepID=UPI00301CD188